MLTDLLYGMRYNGPLFVEMHSEALILETRISQLRTGIRMVCEYLEPGGFMSNDAKVEVALNSLKILLDSDLDKVLK